MGRRATLDGEFGSCGRRVRRRKGEGEGAGKREDGGRNNRGEGGAEIANNAIRCRMRDEANGVGRVVRTQAAFLTG